MLRLIARLGYTQRVQCGQLLMLDHHVVPRCARGRGPAPPAWAGGTGGTGCRRPGAAGVLSSCRARCRTHAGVHRHAYRPAPGATRSHTPGSESRLCSSAWCSAGPAARDKGATPRRHRAGGGSVRGGLLGGGVPFFGSVLGVRGSIGLPSRATRPHLRAPVSRMWTVWCGRWCVDSQARCAAGSASRVARSTSRTSPQR
jgi:hypothetical protein